MDNFFDRNFTEITENSEAANNGLGCLIWQGGMKGAYGVKKLSPPGHKQLVRTAHRALYMCFTRTLELPPDMDASHLCHENKCVNISHLVLEDHNINMGRLECRNNGVCSRKHEPLCMFRYVKYTNKLYFIYFESTSAPRDSVLIPEVLGYSPSNVRPAAYEWSSRSLDF